MCDAGCIAFSLCPSLSLSRPVSLSLSLSFCPSLSLSLFSLTDILSLARSLSRARALSLLSLPPSITDPLTLMIMRTCAWGSDLIPACQRTYVLCRVPNTEPHIRVHVYSVAVLCRKHRVHERTRHCAAQKQTHHQCHNAGSVTYQDLASGLRKLNFTPPIHLSFDDLISMLPARGSNDLDASIQVGHDTSFNHGDATGLLNTQGGGCLSCLALSHGAIMVVVCRS